MQLPGKKIFLLIHRWLGLVTGLVVFIVSVTGALYAFQREIEDALQKYRFVESRNQEILPPSKFTAAAEEQLPDYHLHAINYPGEGRSVEAIFYATDPDHYFISYHDPYTAQIIHVQNMDKSFFRLVLLGHYYLWLPPVIGQPVVAYGTLIFVIMLITGIILWWPRNRQAAKQRFWFSWRSTTRWKRKNYDLHNIAGFYCSWLVLIIALTGMVFGISWFKNFVYHSVGGEKSLVYQMPESDLISPVSQQKPVIDLVWEKMLIDHPDAISIEVHTIENESSAIAANANTRSDVYWTTDYRYFDQYTLEEIPVNHIYGRLKDASPADKLMRMNYDIHIGAILGLPGKILAFLLSLTTASLPVTGFLVWWGRRKKRGKSIQGDQVKIPKIHRRNRLPQI